MHDSSVVLQFAKSSITHYASQLFEATAGRRVCFQLWRGVAFKVTAPPSINIINDLSDDSTRCPLHISYTISYNTLTHNPGYFNQHDLANTNVIAIFTYCIIPQSWHQKPSGTGKRRRRPKSDGQANRYGVLHYCIHRVAPA